MSLLILLFTIWFVKIHFSYLHVIHSNKIDGIIDIVNYPHRRILSIVDIVNDARWCKINLWTTPNDIDIFLNRSPRLPDIKYEWVWEIKYLKKENESELKTRQNESVEQLRKYKRSVRFANRTDVKFASIVFIGKDRYEIVEI